MNGISGFTSQTRLTGLSGFDTETLITELMNAEKIPLNSLKQKRTLVEWKQEAYRDISSSLIGFKSKFFDIVNRSSYLLSANSVKPMAAASSDSDYVTATASSDASAGAQTIKVLQLATADTITGTADVSKGISGTVDETKLASDLAGKKISVTLDGVTKTLTLESYTEDDLASKLQESLDSAFGKIRTKDELGNEIEVSKFNVQYDAENNSLSIDTANGATKVRVSQWEKETDVLPCLGFTSGQSNRISLNSSLASLQGSLNTKFGFNGGGFITFSINGKTITADATDTLQQIFQKINNDTDMDVNISYNEVTDKITLTSKQTGSGDNLNIASVSGDFFSALGIDVSNPSKTEGTDAEVLLNGTQTLIRSTNNFTVNGITYTLNRAHEADDAGETITVTQNTDSVISNIKSFIEEYNKLIDNINGEVSESYDRDYPPLTDDQKDAMDEKEIEKWEEKAKTGLLRNDSILQEITLSMRRALYEHVDGVGLTLKDIGIESQSYTDKGKLYLNEEKLKNALLNKPDEVTKLLNGVSPDNPTYARDLSSAEREDRYNRSGVFQRLSDIVEDYVSTARNLDGDKGILLEKAGIEGDLSNTENTMYDELERYDERIDDMIERLTAKEESYYRKFSYLETMLTRMNQQSSWLTSQLGGAQQ